MYFIKQNSISANTEQQFLSSNINNFVGLRLDIFFWTALFLIAHIQSYFSLNLDIQFETSHTPPLLN